MTKAEKKFFTIVIPTLNEKVHLPKLLKDLESQTFDNFGVIVVDGMSVDKTRQIAKDHGAKVIISKKRNVSYQRNIGAKNCTSKWIVFMDADNRLPKNYLKKVKEYIDENDPDFLSTWMKPDEKTNKDKIIAAIMNIFMDINKNAPKPYVMESMIFAKRECFSRLKGFNINISWREGEDLLERAIKKGMDFHFIKKPRYTYSFRRLKKIGAFKMLQEMSQMEIIKMLRKGGLTQKETDLLYPMHGGDFYKTDKKSKMTLQKFISILFQDTDIGKNSRNLFKKSVNSRKRFFG